MAPMESIANVCRSATSESVSVLVSQMKNLCFFIVFLYITEYITY